MVYEMIDLAILSVLLPRDRSWSPVINLASRCSIFLPHDPHLPILLHTYWSSSTLIDFAPAWSPLFDLASPSSISLHTDRSCYALIDLAPASSTLIDLAPPWSILLHTYRSILLPNNFSDAILKVTKFSDTILKDRRSILLPNKFTDLILLPNHRSWKIGQRSWLREIIYPAIPDELGSIPKGSLGSLIYLSRPGWWISLEVRSITYLSRSVQDFLNQLDRTPKVQDRVGEHITYLSSSARGYLSQTRKIDHPSFMSGSESIFGSKIGSATRDPKGKGTRKQRGTRKGEENKRKERKSKKRESRREGE